MFVPEDFGDVLDINLDGDPDVCEFEDMSHVVDPARKRVASVRIFIFLIQCLLIFIVGLFCRIIHY